MPDLTAPDDGRRSAGRVAAALVVALLALQTAWLVSVPAFGGPDEFDHAYRASSVADGHWAASDTPAAEGRGLLLLADADIVEAAFEACDSLIYTGPDNCTAVTAPDARGEVLVASAAATYNPLWYALIGTVAAPFDGTQALLVMRATSMLLCALVLAGALLLLVPLLGTRWSVLAVLAAATPTLVWSTVVAAPNGLGYAAAVGMWSALLRLGSRRPTPTTAPLVAWTLSSLLVMCTHSTGLVWVALSGLCALPILWSGALRAGGRRELRRAGTALGVVVLGAAACLAWIVLAGTNDPRGEVGAGQNGPAPARVLLQGVVLWPMQSVATLIFRNDAAPIPAYALGVGALGAVIVAALLLGRRAQRSTIVLVCALSLAVPLAATYLTHEQIGAAWQGRYGLPLSTGAVLVSVATVAERLTVGRLAAVVAGAGWVAMHLIVSLQLVTRSPLGTGEARAVVVVLALVALAAVVVAVGAGRPDPVALRPAGVGPPVGSID